MELKIIEVLFADSIEDVNKMIISGRMRAEDIIDIQCQSGAVKPYIVYYRKEYKEGM